MRRATMLDDLRRAVRISAAGDPSWPIAVLTGSPARVLAGEAERRGASLIVMGIGRHNPLDRLFGTETTLATLRESRVPVLAVGPEFPAVPSRAVVGLDFSVASRQAARLALHLLAPGGHLTLVHVRPRFEHPSADWQAWDVEYGRTLPPLFDQVRAQLNVPDGFSVDTVAVRGDPAPALLAFAQQANADLVAVGTQRHSPLERLVVGSVATRVLRTARVGVLAVPATG
jgi:nucleotide-binding universal stress UspA family protein